MSEATTNEPIRYQMADDYVERVADGVNILHINSSGYTQVMLMFERDTARPTSDVTPSNYKLMRQAVAGISLSVPQARALASALNQLLAQHEPT